MIQEGHFREDLYYRLNVVPLHVPALQERVTDIPDLFYHFMAQSAMAHGRPPRRLSEEAMVILQSYPWPGNVRQLKNVVEWILIMVSGDPREDVRVEMLPPEIRYRYVARLFLIPRISSYYLYGKRASCLSGNIC